MSHTIATPVSAALDFSDAVSHRIQVMAAVLMLSLTWASAATAQIPITAAWDPNADGQTAGYRVSVGTSPGSTVAVLDVGASTQVVLPLPPGGIYYLSVRGYTASGTLGPPSAEAVIDLASAPGAPTAVAATVSGTTANLRWSPPVSGGVALRYLVSVGTARGASNVMSDYPVGGVLSLSGALAPGTYFARLQAGNMVGVGPASEDVPFQVGGAAPPTPPSALAATVAGSTVTLTWLAPAGGAESYIIEAGSTSGAINVGRLNVGASRVISAAAPAGTYYVRVRAVRASGISAPSNEVVVRVR